jgi:hypothetical protein
VKKRKGKERQWPLANNQKTKKSVTATAAAKEKKSSV